MGTFMDTLFNSIKQQNKTNYCGKEISKSCLIVAVCDDHCGTLDKNRFFLRLEIII